MTNDNSNNIEVAARFQRSIRIDADLYSSEALNGYVCPPSAKNLLKSLSASVGLSPQRAFTLTGPYGGGKSSLAMVIAGLLGKSPSAKERARNVLGQDLSEELAQSFTSSENGWLVIPVIGSTKLSPERAVLAALSARGITASADEELDVINLLEQIAAEEDQHDGVLLLVDEMGKFLEAAAAGSGSADLFFFQELAERTARLDAKVVTIGFLHQSFDQYATKLSKVARDEWLKIQGRFIDVPFVQTHDETIDLISRAISAPSIPDQFESTAEVIALDIIERRPGTIGDLSSRLVGAWPLHPVVTALLGPISRRSFAQNQRSIFGFLTSGEPSGFQEFVSQSLTDTKGCYAPSDLWDYLQLNLEPSILSSPDGHRWATASDAVARVTALGNELHQSLAKTIGLIEVFRGQSGLSPSEPVLVATQSRYTEIAVRDALDDLLRWSAVIYRKHLGAYALFEGSDFDIEAAIEEELATGLSVELRKLQAQAQLRPVVAKRHYITTGSLRWFEVELCRSSDVEKTLRSFEPEQGYMGKLLLVLPNEDAEPNDIISVAKKSTSAPERATCAVAVLVQGWRIQELSREEVALTNILSNSDALRGDAIARKEVTARIARVNQSLSEVLEQAVSEAEWYWKGEHLGKMRLDQLSQFASDVAEGWFSLTPLLHSELLNRVKPSSNAAAARRALMERMLTREHMENLGYEGYPAEAGLYYTVLKATGLHGLSSEGEWQFDETSCPDDSMRALFAETDKLLQDAKLTDLTELYDLWSQPPYGLANGLKPVIALAYMLSRRSELAIHLHGKFRPRWETIIVDDMLADPRLLSVRRMELNGFREKVLISMRGTIERLSNKKVGLKAFEVAKAMMTYFMTLPEWVRATDQLSSDAKKVRAILKTASDPNKLLFEDLSDAFSDIQADNEDEGATLIANRVGEALAEMAQAYPGMISGLKQHMLVEIGAKGDGLSDLAELQKRAGLISNQSADLRLKSFASRVATFSGDNAQVEGILGMMATAPPPKWRDADLTKARLELTAIATQFRREEVLAHVKTDKAEGHQAIAVVVGSGKASETRMESASLSPSEAQEVQLLAANLRDTLSSMSDKRAIQIATLAEVGLIIMEGE